ncbi:hypothetical protein BDW71DRAFT_178765 [Aspergillus fruticulosus]
MGRLLSRSALHLDSDSSLSYSSKKVHGSLRSYRIMIRDEYEPFSDMMDGAHRMLSDCPTHQGLIRR